MSLNKLGLDFRPLQEGETLIVSKLERLGRDAQDVDVTVKLLASRQVSMIVLQLGELDLTSPMQRAEKVAQHRAGECVSALVRPYRVARTVENRLKLTQWGAVLSDSQHV